MQLRMIIERAAPIPSQPLLERPGYHIAERQEVKVQIESHAVIETEIVVVDRPVMHQRHAERNCLSRLPPDEKASAFRHPAAQLRQVFFREPLEFHRRALVNLQVERINLVDVWT